MPWVLETIPEIVEVSRVGKKVVGKHPGVRLLGEDQPNQVTTDKTRPSSNKDRLHTSCSGKYGSLSHYRPNPASD